MDNTLKIYITVRTTLDIFVVSFTESIIKMCDFTDFHTIIPRFCKQICERTISCPHDESNSSFLQEDADHHSLHYTRSF